MIKHRPPPSKVERREQQFEKLLAAMGMNDAADPFARYALVRDLEQLEANYTRRLEQSSKQPTRKLVRRYRAAVTKVLALSKTVGPDFLTEIEEAGWSRHNPDADVRTLHIVMSEHGHKRNDLVAELTEHRLDIDHWLKTSGDVYKKRDVRKLVVEPFLQLIAEHGITTSRKQLPRKRIFEALFDWLGVERSFRPSSVNIDAIARKLEASVSNSNATQQTEK